MIIYQRPIIPNGVPVWLDGIVGVSQNPGVGTGWTNTFTAWADASDHTKSYTEQWRSYYGGNGLGYFKWNENIFPSFYRGANVSNANNNVALDRSISLKAKIELLDKDGAVLTTTTWNFSEHDTYPAQNPSTMNVNFTASQVTSLGTEIITDFNAVRASLTATPTCPPTPSSSGQFNAVSCVCILYIIFQWPIRIEL